MFRFVASALAVALAFPLAASAQSAPPAPAAPVAPGPPAAGPGAPGAPAPHAHAHHRPRLAAALHTLSLDPDQRRQIDGFVQQTRTANAGADRETRRANQRALRLEIAGVLTPAQRQQLRASLRAQAAPGAAPGEAAPQTVPNH